MKQADPSPAKAPDWSRDEAVRQTLAYEKSLKAYAYVLVRDWPAVDDAFQETVVAILNQWQGVRPGAALHALLRTIIHHRVVDQIRVRCREKVVDHHVLQQGVEQVFAENEADERVVESLQDRRIALRHCLAELGERAAALLQGFHHQARTYAELAADHRMSLEAVRKALFRSRRHLQQCIERRLQP